MAGAPPAALASRFRVLYRVVGVEIDGGGAIRGVCAIVRNDGGAGARGNGAR